LNNNILHILFEDYGNNPDILLPIDAKFISQACAARKFITQQIRKYKLME